MSKQRPSQRRWLLCALASAGASALPIVATAQSFPEKPIKLIIAGEPGGGVDAVGRLIADALAAAFKQPVVCENRPGASGVIASAQLMRAAPDGYTLAIVQNGHTTNPATIKKLPYDTLRDFTPIAPLARSPLVLVSAAATGVKNVNDLVAFGKRTPAAMNFATASTATRMAIEILGRAIGIPINPVNYKGSAPAVTDVAGGHVNFAVTTIASMLSQQGTGKVNFVAILSQDRSPYLPEVATLGEQGLKDIELTAWWGIIAPQNVPKAVQRQLNVAIRAALDDPEVRKRLDRLLTVPWSASSEDFDRFIRNEVATITAVAQKAGIQPE